MAQRLESGLADLELEVRDIRIQDLEAAPGVLAVVLPPDRKADSAAAAPVAPHLVKGLRVGMVEAVAEVATVMAQQEGRPVLGEMVLRLFCGNTLMAEPFSTDLNQPFQSGHGRRRWRLQCSRRGWRIIHFHIHGE